MWPLYVSVCPFYLNLVKKKPNINDMADKLKGLYKTHFSMAEDRLKRQDKCIIIF